MPVWVNIGIRVYHLLDGSGAGVELRCIRLLDSKQLFRVSSGLFSAADTSGADGDIQDSQAALYFNRDFTAPRMMPIHSDSTDPTERWESGKMLAF